MCATVPAIYKPHNRAKKTSRRRRRRRRPRSPRPLFPRSLWKERTKRVLCGRHEDATMRGRMRDFPIEWRHGPGAFRSSPGTNQPCLLSAVCVCVRVCGISRQRGGGDALTGFLAGK